MCDCGAWTCDNGFFLGEDELTGCDMPCPRGQYITGTPCGGTKPTTCMKCTECVVGKYANTSCGLRSDTLCLDCPNKIPALAHYELQSNVSLIAAASVAERRFLGFSADSCTSLGLG